MTEKILSRRGSLTAIILAHTKLSELNGKEEAKDMLGKMVCDLIQELAPIYEELVGYEEKTWCMLRRYGGE